MLPMQRPADLENEVALLHPEARTAFLNECLARAKGADHAAGRTPSMSYWRSLIDHGYPLDTLPIPYRRHMTPIEIMSQCVVVVADRGHPRIPWPQGATEEQAWQTNRLTTIRTSTTPPPLPPTE